MRLPIPLKRRPVLWLLLPALPLLSLVEGASSSAQTVGYWTWTLAHSILLLLVPAGVAATGAALEASRLKRAREANALNVRSGLAVILDALWPSLLAGLLLQVVAVGLVAFGAPGGSSAFPTAITVAIVAMILFHCCVGFLAGAILPPVVGIPLALVFSYSWLGFTGTTDWMPLRHLAGLVLETCCTIDQQVSMTSVASVVVFSVLAAAGCLGLAAVALRIDGRPVAANRRLPAPLTVLSLVLVVVAVAAGLSIARGLGSTAVEARSASELRCETAGSVEVCLFPEQRAEGDPSASIAALVDTAGDAGVPIARRVQAGYAENADGIVFVRYESGMTTHEIANSLVSGFDGDQTLVCDEPVARTLQRYEVGGLVRSWLYIVMTSESDLASVAEAQALDDVSPLRDLLSLPSTGQAAWVEEGMRSLEGCDAGVPALPGDAG